MSSNHLSCLFAALLLLSSAGCSQSQKTTAAAPASDPGKTEKSADTSPKKKTVEAVDPARMQELLPESLPDLPRKDFKGDFVTAGSVKTSKAFASYVKEKQSVEIEIRDFAEAAEKIEMGYGWTTQDFDRKLENGYEKTSYCQKWYKSYEMSDEKNMVCKYMVYAGSRFIVSAVGQNVGIDVIKAGVDKIDFKKLSTLK